MNSPDILQRLNACSVSGALKDGKYKHPWLYFNLNFHMDGSRAIQGLVLAREPLHEGRSIFDVFYAAVLLIITLKQCDNINHLLSCSPF